MSIPTTKDAPAFEANIERIPVPHPTYSPRMSAVLKSGVGTYIENGLAFEDLGVLHDGISVRQGSHGILEHLLVDT